VVPQWVFYNVKNPSYTVEQYQKPAELTDKEWATAKEQNPDDRLLVPVVAVGFDGLLARTKAQDDSVARLQDCCKVREWGNWGCRCIAGALEEGSCGQWACCKFPTPCRHHEDPHFFSLCVRPIPTPLLLLSGVAPQSLGDCAGS
jgi:hypothetical protein